MLCVFATSIGLALAFFADFMTSYRVVVLLGSFHFPKLVNVVFLQGWSPYLLLIFVDHGPPLSLLPMLRLQDGACASASSTLVWPSCMAVGKSAGDTEGWNLPSGSLGIGLLVWTF